MSILAGNHLLTPARYGEGTYYPGPVRLTRAPQNPPEYSRTFSRGIKIHNDRADLGPTPVCS